MAEAPKQPEQAQDNRGVLRLRYDHAATNYSNFTLVAGQPEEVVVNFGISANPPRQQNEVEIEVTSRILMSYPSAKRLAISLGNIIQRFEQTHGVINIQPQQSAQPAAQRPAQESK